MQQLCVFPNARFDDIADAVSQASIWLQANTFELGLVGYFKKLASGARKLVALAEERLRGTEETPMVSNTSEQARVEGFLAWQKAARAPACPTCGNTSTTYNEQRQIRCLQCGATDGELPSTATNCNCGNFLRQTVGDLVRCGNCGWQSTPQVAAGAMSRKGHEMRAHGFVRFG